MKVLVVGKNSYIAQEFVKCVGQIQGWEVQSLSVRDEEWRTFEYSSYNSIIYFAAIVHHPEINDEQLYQKVNVEIPFEMAKIVRNQGVSQFVYISTCAVWGIGPLYGKQNVIDRTTPILPESLYGKSKAFAEERLEQLNSNEFHIARVRLPNVYGHDCPGTFYHRIELLSRLPLFPIDKKNRPFSLISVKNVAKALIRIVKEQMHGVLVPQDPQIVSITERIKKMAEERGKRQIQFRWLWPVFWIIHRIRSNKYLNNLYGEYYIDPIAYPVIVETE